MIDVTIVLSFHTHHALLSKKERREFGGKKIETLERKQWHLLGFQPHPTSAPCFPLPETSSVFTNSAFISRSSASSSVNSPPTLEILIDDENKQEQEENESFSLKPTLFKRPHLQQQSSGCLTKNPTLSKGLDGYGGSAQNPHAKTNLLQNRARRFLSHFHQLPLRIHLVLSLPFLYFMVTYPSRSFILDFPFAFAFSYVLLFSLNLTVPRLPTIRLFLVRSLPDKIRKKDHVCQPHLPVVWSIGSVKTVEENVISLSGCHVQDYSNGDVYEGEFHEGKFSGGGVYYYQMSGRYEGDWIDGKHDGYGVETWAMGSRYRGQYRQGLRHGIGVYRFYTGDMYAGEWSNGQSNGWGTHTCEDGSRSILCLQVCLKCNEFTKSDIVFATGMATDMLENILLTRYMDLESITLPTATVMRGLGTRVEDRVLEHILSEMETLNPAIGKTGARRAAEKAQAATTLDERVNKAVTAAVLAANAARVAAVKAVQKRMHHLMQK
ncbi:UNVERIFIED_CONTAM: hypothetical protein Sradi_5811900 [Sesamum radiatum]|uniref:Uncharacterized protein n=1 Tax=Sesamum radiatum TaxID=300843 RepID=A0AAW2KSJ7_SESRA